MAQNITLLGASYSDVPSVLLPKTGGGTAQFDDTTIASNAASASDIANGKLAFVNGLLITGTASGGGGGGLVYETGTWTPTEDAYQKNIYFTGTYSILPFCVMLYDTGSTAPAASSIMYCGIHNWYSLDGSAYKTSTTTVYARVDYTYTNSSNQSSGGQYITGLNGGTNTDLNGWLQLDHFRAYSSSSSRFFRSGRTYKWVAVWAPTS